MEKTIKLTSNEEAIELYGTLDENLRFAEKEYRVRVAARNHRLKIVGLKINNKTLTLDMCYTYTAVRRNIISVLYKCYIIFVHDLKAAAKTIFGIQHVVSPV